MLFSTIAMKLRLVMLKINKKKKKKIKNKKSGKFTHNFIFLKIVVINIRCF